MKGDEEKGRSGSFETTLSVPDSAAGAAVACPAVLTARMGWPLAGQATPLLFFFLERAYSVTWLLRNGLAFCQIFHEGDGGILVDFRILLKT